MKNYLLLLIALVISTYVVCGQNDTSKTQIIFQTKDAKPLVISKIIHVGDIDLEGYGSDGYNFYRGSLTKKEFLLNAPNTCNLKKDSIYQLVMDVKNYSGLKFTIDTKINNQVWMLTPAGKKFNKSVKQLYWGIAGVVLSALTYGLVASINQHENKVYEMKLDSYNAIKEMGSFFQQGPPPERPKNMELRYVLPTITMGISVSFVIRGKQNYQRNKPMAVRID